jgi:hypothetical protein
MMLAFYEVFQGASQNYRFSGILKKYPALLQVYLPNSCEITVVSKAMEAGSPKKLSCFNCFPDIVIIKGMRASSGAQLVTQLVAVAWRSIFSTNSRRVKSALDACSLKSYCSIPTFFK